MFLFFKLLVRCARDWPEAVGGRVLSCLFRFCGKLAVDHRMLAGDATRLAGRLLHKRKETAGLPRQWPKKEKTVCFLQSH